MEQMCNEHGESFRVLHQKLDAMIERQIDYAETSAYNAYVEECRAWGRREKEKLK